MTYADPNADELPDADYAEWISRDLWTLLEGAALIAGREPPKPARGPSDVSSRITDATALRRFDSAYEHLKRRTSVFKSDPAHPLGIPFYGSIVLEGDRPRPGRRQVEPKRVIALALEKGLDVPGPLLKAFKCERNLAPLPKREDEHVTENDWIAKCRAIADKLDAKDAEVDAWDSVQNIAVRVAKEAINCGIRGPHGQLTHGNILREALQGERWNNHRRKKPKN